MIRINKPQKAPSVLDSRGKKEADKLKKLFDATPQAYLNGDEKFSFKSSIYGHKTVKRSLINTQHGKCVFCEVKKETGEGHVEHFRPKGGYKQNPEDSLGVPGYYWLAYEWDNLFFSCFTCNSSYKKNLFPLTDSTKRAQNHHDDLSEEDALLIHPVDDEPEEFIEFNAWYVRPVENNKRGEITILHIGLDRNFHEEERMNHYLGLKKIWNIAHQKNTPPQVRHKLLNLLETYSQPDKTYSSMVKCAIRDRFRY